MVQPNSIFLLHAFTQAAPTAWSTHSSYFQLCKSYPPVRALLNRQFLEGAVLVLLTMTLPSPLPPKLKETSLLKPPTARYLTLS